MSISNRNILAFYFVILCTTLLAFRFTQLTALLFIPLLVGLVICSRRDLITGLCIFLLYLSVEGALKLMSEYSLPLRLGPDLMILALLFQGIRMEAIKFGRIRLFSAPFAVFFWIHVLWVLVQFFNPYSIGIDSSLAAYKVYVSSLLLYFITYRAVEKGEDLEKLSWCMLAIVLLQLGSTAYQFQIREAGLAQWSGGYLSALGVAFRGVFFRPFGLSNVPGGGTTMIYILTPICLCLLAQRRKFWSIAACAILLLAIAYVLFISQVRAALIKCLFGMALFVIITAFRNPKAFWALAAALFVGIFSFSFLLGLQDSRFQIARQRIHALSNIEQVWSDRSQGTLQSMVRIVSEAPFGIGLSRVGAASAPFRDRIEKDKRFGLVWSFADNLYKALLIELGVPGLLFFLTFLGLVFIQALRLLIKLWKDRTFAAYAWIVAATAGVASTFLGHVGSEGFLYQPESSLVWILLAAVLKSGGQAVDSRRSHFSSPSHSVGTLTNSRKSADTKE